ncbi:MAG: hypothetical protein R2748_21910 [Bryobacterales bacterium]
MPAYIRPLLAPIELRAGERVRLGPFRAVFYYRDLQTLDPLRQLVEDSKVRFTGRTRAEVELDWIERIAFWSRRAVIWRGVDTARELEIPVRRWKDLSAKALFALAEPVARAEWSCAGRTTPGERESGTRSRDEWPWCARATEWVPQTVRPRQSRRSSRASCERRNAS